jgi:tetratricopeptide (TPR) repeat protein
MRLKSRPIFLLLVLALPLLLSHCAKKQGTYSALKGVKPGEITKDSPFYDSWGWSSGSKRPPRLEGTAIPPERLEALADLSLQTKDYESSLISYLEVLRQNPERYDLRYKVGVIFLLTGKLEAARQELGQVLVQQPEMLEAHEALGLVYLTEKRYPDAIQEFQTVLAKEPRRAKTRYLQSIAYLDSGQTRRAIPLLKEVAQLEPKQVTIYATLGQAYISLKDYTQAITWLKKGQSIDPDNQKVNYQLGMALAGLKRYPEALEAFLKAGDEAQAYNNIGVHYFIEGKYEEAAKCFQRALELRPTFYGEAKANLQRALEKLQQQGKDSS